MQSIINGSVDYVIGKQIQYSPTIATFAEKVNADGETLEDIAKKAATDLFIFGGFALQIIYNKMGQISELYWLDFRNIRLNKEGN